MALTGSTRRRLGNLWLQFVVSACVLVAPPLLIAAGMTYFGFPLTNAPEASQIGALPSGSAMRLASLDGLAVEHTDPAAFAWPGALRDRSPLLQARGLFDERFEGIVDAPDTAPGEEGGNESEYTARRPPVVLPNKAMGRLFVSSGIASVYNDQRTASGERMRPDTMTAAHRSLPFGTQVTVFNRHNGRSAVVRINDRGPFVRGRVIDLSPAAARALGIDGLASVSLMVGGIGGVELSQDAKLHDGKELSPPL